MATGIPESGLSAGDHTVTLTFSDSTSTSRTEEWTFNVLPSTMLDPALASPLGTGNESGFLGEIYQVFPGADFDGNTVTANMNESPSRS